MSQKEDLGANTGRRGKWMRRLVIAGGALVLVIVGMTLALNALLPAEKLRALVVPRLESAIGREVSLGAVRLTIFPRFAVRLDELAIANAPGFGAEPALRMEALDVQVRLLPLFRRQIELARLRLVRPEIHYEIDERGLSNFADIGGGGADRAGEEQGQAAGAGAAAGALVVADVLIRDGILTYADRRTARTVSLILNARLSADRGPGETRSLQSSGRIDATSILVRFDRQAKGESTLPDVRVEYELLVDLPGDSMVLRDLRMIVGDVPLAGSGRVLGLTGAGGRSREVDLSLESEEVGIAKLLASLPLTGRAAQVQATGRARLSLRATGPVGAGAVPRLQGEVNVNEFAAAYGDYGRLLTDGAGSITFDDDELSVPAFRAQLLGGPLRLSLTVTEFADPVIDGRAEVTLDLARLMALREGATPLTGNVSADLSFSGRVQRPESLRIRGPLELSGIRYEHESLAVPAEIEAATIQLTGAGVSTDAIPIRLGASDITVAFSARRFLPYTISRGTAGRPPVIEFSVNSERLDLSEIMVMAEEETTGYSDLLTARLAGRQLDGRDPAEIARERYTLPPLTMLEANGRVEIARFINPPNEARNVAFDVVVKDGVLETKRLRGRVHGGRLRGNVSIDFSQGRPPYPLTYDLRLIGADAGALVSRWTRLGSALTGKLDFDIGGRTMLDDAFLPTVSATHAIGNANFSEGSFQNFGITRALTNQFKLDRDVLSGFQQFGGSYEIKDGTFVLDGWQFAAGDIAANITGSAGLGGTLNLSLAMQVPPSLLQSSGLLQGGGLLGDLVGQLAGDDEAIDLAVGIGGTMSRPRVTVDTDALAQALQGRLEDAGADLLRRLIRPPE